MYTDPVHYKYVAPIFIRTISIDIVCSEFDNHATTATLNIALPVIK